jgi:hypothetical protein
LSVYFSFMPMSISTLIFRDRPIAALVVICLSVFVISVDATIVTSPCPRCRAN